MASILIADDEEPVRFALRHVLEEAGHSVGEAEDGSKALKAIASWNYDLLITDILMPDRDGIEMIIRLKRENPTLPIIAISGGGQVGPHTYLEMAIALQVDVALPKPIRPAELLKAVDRALAGGKGA